MMIVSYVYVNFINVPYYVLSYHFNCVFTNGCRYREFSGLENLLFCMLFHIFDNNNIGSRAFYFKIIDDDEKDKLNWKHNRTVATPLKINWTTCSNFDNFIE